MKKAEEIVDAILGDGLFELANIHSVDSGLRHMVWISDNSELRHHRPRMKVQGTDKGLYPVSVDDRIEFLAGWPPGWTAKDFRQLQKFIALNRQVILGHWNKEISSKEALNRIQPVGGLARNG